MWLLWCTKVVTIVTLLQEKLEACGWGVCRMVEVPHRQHHMDLHNRLEMGCAKRQDAFS